MPLDKVTFRGVDVWHRKMTAGRRLVQKSESRTHPAVCAVSEQEIKEGDQVYLVLTNWKLFDNCWVLASEIERSGWEPALATICSKFDDFVRIYTDFGPYRRIFGDAPTALARKVQ